MPVRDNTVYKPNNTEKYKQWFVIIRNNVCKKKLGLEIFSYSTVRKEDEKEKCEDLKSFSANL